ncbi:exonuclease subunit SbcC [human gut metagenome]|uniref:Exonuclease subunit SbcC n=1 Tax=human gut metagenome TaxID=408170 RepID=K1RIZ2_9ZZZZ
MKFLQLEILNLASLDKQGGEVINFEEGALGESTIFSIIGPTGSGKSTLLDAICLALYNRAPRYPRKKGDKNQSIEIFGAADASESILSRVYTRIYVRRQYKGYILKS